MKKRLLYLFIERTIQLWVTRVYKHIASSVFLVSTILPTLCTVVLMAYITKACMSLNNAYAIHENMEDVCPVCGATETNESMCACDNQALLQARQAEVDIANDVENSVHDNESKHDKNEQKEDA